MCNIHGKRINHDLLRRQGSGYVASHGPDLMVSPDTWFMGVTLQYGADGAVFVSDWSDTGECHSYKNTQRQTGRIFKISFGTPSATGIDLSSLSDQELVDYQTHANDWYVRHARRNLQQRADAGQDMSGVHRGLLKIFAENDGVPRKLRALWALFVTGGTNESFLTQALSHESEYVRAWSVRLLTESQISPATRQEFAKLAVSDPSPFVRLHLASALQRLPLDDRWPIVTGLAGHAEDADDANLPLMIWYGTEPLVGLDTGRAIRLAGEAKIPLLRQFIARRAAELR